MAKYSWQAARLMGDWTIEKYLTHAHAGRPYEHTHRLRGYSLDCPLSSEAEAKAVARLLNEAYRLATEEAESRETDKGFIWQEEQMLDSLPREPKAEEAESNG